MTTKPLLSDAEVESIWERIKTIPPRSGQPFMLLSRAIESAVLAAAERAQPAAPVAQERSHRAEVATACGALQSAGQPSPAPR